MLKTIREKINAFLLFLENANVPNGWKNTYETVLSFILIVWLLAGFVTILSFVSITNLVVLAVLALIVGALVWFYKTFGKGE